MLSVCPDQKKNIQVIRVVSLVVFGTYNQSHTVAMIHLSVMTPSTLGLQLLTD